VPWTQTPKEIHLVLALPPNTKARDILWKLTSKEIELRCKTQASGEPPLLAGPFYYPVRPDDSVWELEDAPGGGRQIRIALAKAKPNVKWDCCFMEEVDETVTHRTFMDVSIGGRPVGRIVFGLYGNSYPKTVENFRCLCTGERGGVRLRKKAPVTWLHYKGTSFFRVVPGFLCQAGDVTHHPQHLGGRSIYGAQFDDEGFKIKHKGAGDLLMANAGIAHNNHSQFAVAMSHLTEFETKHVIFGKVLEGLDIFKVMELEGSGEGTTKRKILIDDCGELNSAGQPLEPPPTGQKAAASASDGNDATATADALAPSDEDDGPVLEEVDDNGSGDDGPRIEEVHVLDDDDDDDGPALEVQ